MFSKSVLCTLIMLFVLQVSSVSQVSSAEDTPYHVYIPIAMNNVCEDRVENAGFAWAIPNNLVAALNIFCLEHHYDATLRPYEDPQLEVGQLPVFWTDCAFVVIASETEAYHMAAPYIGGVVCPNREFLADYYEIEPSCEEMVYPCVLRVINYYEEVVAYYESGGKSQYLKFGNEFDLASQANRTPQQAYEILLNLRSLLPSGILLVGPNATTPSNTIPELSPWFWEFLDVWEANRTTFNTATPVDIWGFHFYQMGEPDVHAFIDNLSSKLSARGYHELPFWVMEFGVCSYWPGPRQSMYHISSGFLTHPRVGKIFAYLPTQKSTWDICTVLLDDNLQMTEVGKGYYEAIREFGQ